MYTPARLLWKGQEAVVHWCDVGDGGIVELEWRQIWPEHQSKGPETDCRR